MSRGWKESGDESKLNWEEEECSNLGLSASADGKNARSELADEVLVPATEGFNGAQIGVAGVSLRD